MADGFNIFELIGAAAGAEGRRTEASTSNHSSSPTFSPAQKASKDGENPSVNIADVESQDEQGQSVSKAQQEEEEFSSNTSELHEYMQKNRMDNMQAQLDMVRTEIASKAAETTGKEIDNDLRKKMASFTVQFMSWWCLFVAAMFTSFMIAHEGKPPAEAVIALLGTSTISIVGLVGFVVSGLFKSRKEGDKDK